MRSTEELGQEKGKKLKEKLLEKAYILKMIEKAEKLFSSVQPNRETTFNEERGKWI